MPAAVQIGLWGLAALLPLAINLSAFRHKDRQYPDSVGLSMMMVLMWALYNIIMILPPGRPENMASLSVMDLIGMMISLGAWATRPRVYKLAVAMLFLTQLGIHATFWFMWPADGLLHRYTYALNLTFALQLVACSTPGGIEIGRRCFSLVLGRWRHRLHLGSG